MVAPFYFV